MRDGWSDHVEQREGEVGERPSKHILHLNHDRRVKRIRPTNSNTTQGVKKSSQSLIRSPHSSTTTNKFPENEREDQRLNIKSCSISNSIQDLAPMAHAIARKYPFPTRLLNPPIILKINTLVFLPLFHITQPPLHRFHPSTTKGGNKHGSEHKGKRETSYLAPAQLPDSQIFHSTAEVFFCGSQGSRREKAIETRTQRYKSR